MISVPKHDLHFFIIKTANKAKLLRIACLKHDELMMDAQNGLGIALGINCTHMSIILLIVDGGA